MKPWDAFDFLLGSRWLGRTQASVNASEVNVVPNIFFLDVVLKFFSEM